SSPAAAPRETLGCLSSQLRQRFHTSSIPCARKAPCETAGADRRTARPCGGKEAEQFCADRKNRKYLAPHRLDRRYEETSNFIVGAIARLGTGQMTGGPSARTTNGAVKPGLRKSRRRAARQ